MKLTESEIAQELAKVADWTLDQKSIVRRYRFESFRNAMAFANAVADIAEVKNHHPFIAIDYKFVTLRLTTWHQGGLTKADFEEATLFDEIYASMSSGA
ncbi:4a-hydroxytetrahydrobiopterin dehydratase [Alicyclobacillus pomorum]|uniref:4a-hydroxytetrahydrobiopterin dehydratase n=1 Tax=Alicyclobacillus pomorum TaxID=204470 RepID=UPI000414B13F|nr:4a-hydroxytetrahydrobiopterin dehydratase [Alicyclobacillus pomorum]